MFSGDFLPSKLKESLLVPELSEDQLLKNVRLLSHNFTDNRKNIAEYLSSPEMVSAYAWFYLATNVFKLEFFLTQLSQAQRDFLGEHELLDMGTGPGTYALSWAKLIPKGASIQGIDLSEIMLQQAQKLATGLNLQERISFKNYSNWFSSEKKTNSASILLMGNVLNENNHQWFWTTLKKANPKFLLLIEPGTSEQFRNILPIRQELIAQGWVNLYPCPSSYSCPMGSGADWCHQVVYPKLDPEIHRLCQLAQLDRRTLPTLIHFYYNQGLFGEIPAVFSSSPVKAQERTARTVQYLGSNKHSLEYKVCRSVEECNRIETWEIAKKYLDKQAIKKLEAAGIGITLRGDEEKNLGNGRIRVRLPNL